MAKTRSKKQMTEKPEPPRHGTYAAVYEPEMPYPYVHYSGEYGTFISFSEHPESEPYFCACASELIKRYRKLLTRNERTDARAFPAYYHEHRFSDGLCHRCNRKTPLAAYCHPMYGGNFMRDYGWYVKQERIAQGLAFCNLDFSDSRMYDFTYCDGHLRALLIEYRDMKRQNEEINASYALGDDEAYMRRYYSDLNLQRFRTGIENKIINAVRADFGIKPVGDRWTEETKLCGIVASMFPDVKIIRHCRESWLEGLELDIYIPSRKIGIEYQGAQHYTAVKHWGGEMALAAQKLRDERKREICTAHGVCLVEFTYLEPISANYVRARIDLISSILQHP